MRDIDYEEDQKCKKMLHDAREKAGWKQFWKEEREKEKKDEIE